MIALEPNQVFGSLDNYLGTFAGAMADRVATGLRPLFDPGRDELSQEVRDLLDCEMVPYPAQAAGVEGLVRLFDHSRNGWLVGEMGSGKTPMGLWTVRVMERKLGRPMRVVITAPNQLAKKWRRHCQIVLPGCRAVILKNWRDLEELVAKSTVVHKMINGDGEPLNQKLKRWKDPECTEVWILPRDRGKLGYAWSTGVSHTRKIVRIADRDTGEVRILPITKFRCPKCGAIITDRKGNDAGLDHFVTKRGALSSKRTCSAIHNGVACGEPLWQAYNGSNGLIQHLDRDAVMHRRPTIRRHKPKRDRSPGCHPEMVVPKVAPRRMAPCQYLRKIGFRFDMYIADECFVGDTPIETPSGQIRIDEIRPGDLVTTARDCGQIVAKPVSRVIRKPVAKRRMIRIVHESGAFVTTPSHMVYTTSGKIQAESVTISTVLLQYSHAVRDQDVSRLRPGVQVPDPAHWKAGTGLLQPVMRVADPTKATITRKKEREAAELQMVRDGVHAATVPGPPNLLLPQLLNESPTCHTPDPVEVDSQAANCRSAQGGIGTHEAHEPYAGVQEQGRCCETRKTILRHPWRQWLADPTAEEVGGGAVVADRISRQDGSAFVEVRRCGSGLPRDQAGDRSGRRFTSYKETEESRSPEGSYARSTRLDGDAVLEQRDRQGSGECGGDRTSHSRVIAVEEIEVEEAVYDLEVEDTHRYFAGGALVSNCHELKGEGTLQGQMFADLCLISQYRLMLTGTLVGGYADNLLHLLWRTIASRLVDEGLTHDTAGFTEYIRLYGVLQTVKRYTAENNWQTEQDLVMGRGKMVSNRSKVMPGISPVLFVNFMLDQAVFLRLMEMTAHLPRFEPRIHTVPLTAAQDEALLAMQKEFEDHRRRVKPCRAWSKARHVFLRWPDKPWVDEFDVMDRGDDDRPIYAFHVPSLPKQEYPKERRVRRIIRRNMLRGRKTWVFTELAGRDREPFWDWMEYLESYLEKHGIRAVVLRSQNDGGPKPEDREEWIEKHAAGVDVVISNPALVQTGLDLYDFPSIVFAFCGDNTYRLRQASRRAWRLGQKHTCEVDYVIGGSEQTADRYPLLNQAGEQVGWTRKSRAKHVQAAALSLMAAKMEASLAIEGDFSAEGLVALSQSEDMASQLAKFIDGRLNDLDPVKTAFEKYRAKLDQCMPELGTAVRGNSEAVLEPRPALELPATPKAPAPEAPEIESPVVSREDLDAALSVLEALGIELADEDRARAVSQTGSPAPEDLEIVEPPAAEERSEVEAIFEQPALSREEPSGIRERKAMRLRALCNALGVSEPDETSGDQHRFGSQWVQLVAKARSTVRERNFSAINEEHPGSMIAFVEPVDEAGPTVSNTRTTVAGVEYVVSMMLVDQYMSGARTPGGVPALAAE